MSTYTDWALCPADGLADGMIIRMADGTRYRVCGDPEPYDATRVEVWVESIDGDDDEGALILRARAEVRITCA